VTATNSKTEGGRTALPPLCYVRHPGTGETVQIRLGQNGWHLANTTCSPECVNAKLPRVPTSAEVLAMKHGSMMGWDTPGANPEMWKRSAEAGAR
jgi:hypothetical protein